MCPDKRLSCANVRTSLLIILGVTNCKLVSWPALLKHFHHITPSLSTNRGQSVRYLFDFLGQVLASFLDGFSLEINAARTGPIASSCSWAWAISFAVQVDCSWMRRTMSAFAVAAGADWQSSRQHCRHGIRDSPSALSCFASERCSIVYWLAYTPRRCSQRAIWSFGSLKFRSHVSEE